MNRAYKYRIYPTAEQASLIQQTFGCCRFVYNQMLSVQQERHRNNEKHLSGFDSFKYMTADIKPVYPWLKDVDSTALMNSVFALDDAYNRFFRRQGGFPKYKSKRRSRRSYTSTRTGNNIRVMEKGIRLPKLGLVRAKLHRMAPADWKLKSATVSQDSRGDYYCSILYGYEADVSPVVPDKEKMAGLDYKTSCLYADSSGDTGDMPKYYKAACKRLAKEQRKLSRKTGSGKNEPKSRNYLKQLKKVNRIHCHTANQRKDFLHKRSTETANRYDVVCIEDISIKEQLQKRKYKNFRRSTSDNGWYSFTAMLDYKLKERGKQLIRAGKGFPSTKMCHCCGEINHALVSDSVRKWECPVCHTVHDRDINAAVNLRNEAVRIVFG